MDDLENGREYFVWKSRYWCKLIEDFIAHCLGASHRRVLSRNLREKISLRPDIVESLGGGW
jgi:hypothetical protein